MLALQANSACHNHYHCYHYPILAFFLLCFANMYFTTCVFIGFSPIPPPTWIASFELELINTPLTTLPFVTVLERASFETTGTVFSPWASSTRLLFFPYSNGKTTYLHLDLLRPPPPSHHLNRTPCDLQNPEYLSEQDGRQSEWKCRDVFRSRRLKYSSHWFSDDFDTFHSQLLLLRVRPPHNWMQTSQFLPHWSWSLRFRWQKPGAVSAWFAHNGTDRHFAGSRTHPLDGVMISMIFARPSTLRTIGCNFQGQIWHSRSMWMGLMANKWLLDFFGYFLKI